MTTINQLFEHSVKFRFAIPGALVAIALLAAGCGSDDSAEALTKAEFVKQADRICERTDKVQRDGFRDYFAERPKAAVSQAENEKVVVAVGLPALQTEAEELGDLAAPEGDEDQVEAIVEGMQEAVERAEEDPSSLVNLKNGAGPFTEVGKMAEEYGLKACSLPL